MNSGHAEMRDEDGFWESVLPTAQDRLTLCAYVCREMGENFDQN